MKHLLFLFFTSIVSFVFSQNSQIKRTNHWYFGGGAGLDFSSGTAVADTNGQMNVYAGCSTMSDTAGNLLMYTDGVNVWNKNHQIMPNGTGLFGVGTPVQSSVIIPKPLDDNLYYILTCAGTDGTQYGVRYSIVDMTLNGGLGAVTLKNELLFQPSSEQLGATMHANCTDVWIMGHEATTDNYRAYLLTANGIDTNNVVINTIGNYPKEYNLGYGLKFSPNGKKMAASNYWDNYSFPALMDTLDLCDFDNTSGILSNLIKLPDTAIIAYNFSPDSKLLYVENYNTQMGFLWIIPGFEETFQYDISSNIPGIIKSSKTLIHQITQDMNFSDFQIGADNSIYVADPYRDSISVIKYPNIPGIGCNVLELAVPLNGKTSYISLPNFVSSYFNQNNTAGCFYTVGINEIHDADIDITAYPNPFSSSCIITISGVIPNSIMNLSISLRDMLGRETKSSVILSEAKNLNNETTITINRIGLPAGIYSLNISVNNQSYTQKLIITN